MSQPIYVLNLFDVSNEAQYMTYSRRSARSDLNPPRVDGTSNYIWHLFDKLEDLRSILK